MQLEVPIIDRSKPVATRLSDQERRELFSLTQLPGYGILLRLMEMHCILQDVLLAQVPANDEKLVLSEHRIAQGKWGFFVFIQKQVKQEVNELLTDQDDRLKRAEMADQVERDQVLDPMA